MTTPEELGPVKDGLYGPPNPDCHSECGASGRENYGVHLVMEEIDYNDKDVLASIGTGKCDGIFHLRVRE